MSKLIEIITSTDSQIRDQSLDLFCRTASLNELLKECNVLDLFRKKSENLYERVRALFFLYAIYRFHIPLKFKKMNLGLIPFEGYENILNRRFEEAIEIFLYNQNKNGTSDSIASALAETYYHLGFQTLADQVRKSVRSVSGNHWMFRVGHPIDHPLRIRPELLKTQNSDAAFPILKETTPVRMDLTHSGWSDIFFLGMDFPEGARVLNVSIDLNVRSNQKNNSPKPPVEAYIRIIDRPILRLVSVDLEATAEITSLAEVFDFAKDYLGLLKAAVIASGIVPSGMEGAEQSLSDLLDQLVKPGFGIEIVSQVNGIPKGSRLAVSTSLLACLIAVCMRATGQTESLTGQLKEDERRLVAARAILGEWLGGSGGGWQDSGGVWPGVKLIQGEIAADGDPEFGISRGRLIPSHHIFNSNEISKETRQRLQESLVLVHGGMAQDVGPILEMVTEKYLLRSEKEWKARKQAMTILDRVVTLFRSGDIKNIGSATHQNFFEPIQNIIPWASNLYSETLIDKVKNQFNNDFWGFWMLGGMSGGGMGFIFHPNQKIKAQESLQTIMSETKQKLEDAVPFAIEPVVYDFAINEKGTDAKLLIGQDDLMPTGYYSLTIPDLLKIDSRKLTQSQQTELSRFSMACATNQKFSRMTQNLFDRLLPQARQDNREQENLSELLDLYGFDKEQHEKIRADLRSGRIGLAQNRVPVSSKIEDVKKDDVVFAVDELPQKYYKLGLEALSEGAVAVVSLAGGAGSRWTKGAGVVKALNPFCKLGGKHRNFIEVHLAKSRKISKLCLSNLPHIITTSYLTHKPIFDYLKSERNYNYLGNLILSPGKFVGLRLIPMIRDLRFAWEELPQQLLDEQAQKVLESLHNALIDWAQQMGEGNDYTDNLPTQCLHPVGHWYEIPNLLRDGVFAALLGQRSRLKYLMIHNIDTLGANVDPAILGYFINSGSDMATEVITKRIDDRGGGLAKIDGQIRLIEGLALPHEEIEFNLSFYNTSTTWIDIDQLLKIFSLNRDDLKDEQQVALAIREVAERMPTYITLKDVKKRWGKGQEDIYPVTQFEKLWGDMTALSEINSSFIVVPRRRGQQLKEVAQLDGWLRDGSAEYLDSICDWE